MDMKDLQVLLPGDAYQLTREELPFSLTTLGVKA